jgi:hypothetical protein
MLNTGLVGEEVKCASGGVSFDLTIPPSVVVFDEPLAQACKSLIVEIFNLPLDLLNVAHSVLRPLRL